MPTRRALVVDDDPDLLALVTKVVEAMSFEVVRASAGDNFLEILAHGGPFQLVVTDVAMPRMTGLQVMHSARAAGLRVPTVVMTARRGADIAGSAAALGADVVLLYKPFTVATLRAAIQSPVPTTC